MAFLITVQWADAYGRTTNKSYENNRALVADALTDAAAIIAAMGDISDLGAVKYDVSQLVAVNDTPVAGSNVDVGATIHVLLDNSKGYGLKVPGIMDSMLNTDGSVKIDDAAVAAFTALFQTAGHFRMSEGNYITTVRSGELDK